MNHLHFHSLVKKFCQWGVGWERQWKANHVFMGVHTANLQTPLLYTRHSAWRLRVRTAWKKKSNQNGFSRRRKNKATRCVISGMSFAHRPLDDASQRWPVEVMVADARWSVSLTLPNRDSIYRSKCYTFLCHSDINLTLLHRAGTAFIHEPQSGPSALGALFHFTDPQHWELGIGNPRLPRLKEPSQFHPSSEQQNGS